MCIKDMDEASLRASDLPFSTPSSTGQEVQLGSKHNKINCDNKHEYVRLALNYR